MNSSDPTATQARRRPFGRLGRPTSKDAVSGFVTGLFSIPEGMAYASIGGFAAPLGLWSGIVPTIVGSIFARTVLMVTTLTSAIALTSSSVLSGVGLDPGDAGAIATLTVLTGLVMLTMGLLRLGAAMSFISTAVMTGFTTGIALQIITGVIDDATGYETPVHNSIGKVVDAVIHIGDWDLPTVAVTLATIAIWAGFRAIRRLRPLATLLALVVVTVGVSALPVAVELVSDIAAIPRSLPPFTLPDLSALPGLFSGAVAIALVALAQSAGVGSAVPNPDGSKPNVSQDFTAQGLANIAGGFFSALPTGGSLSRTGVSEGAGAQTRWAGIFAGFWLLLIVLTVGPFAGYIPMAVIGALMLTIGAELIAGRIRDIRLVSQTSVLSAVAMVITFLGATQLPLQYAIFLGAGLSVLLTAVAISRTGRVVQLVRGTDGGWTVQTPEPRLASGRTTVLHYSGIGFFAEVNRMLEEWPEVAGAENAAIVLLQRGVSEVPSATFLSALADQYRRLNAEGIPLVFAGLDTRTREYMLRTADLTGFDPRDLIAATPELTGALESAYARAEELRTHPV